MQGKRVGDEEGVELGEEAIIYAGGTLFMWRRGGGREEEAWTFKEFSAMLKSWRRRLVVCPVTLDTLQTDHVAESIRGRSLKPWDRLVSRLRWLNTSTVRDREPLPSSSPAIVGGGGFFSASSLVAERERVVTGRPWVFIQCGHVVSFMDIPTYTPHTTPPPNPLTFPCFVCRTPSRFVPLIARLNPYLLPARATHCFDPCGHMIHAAGAQKWGTDVVVPRVGRDPRVWDTEPVWGTPGGVGRGSGWCHVCPFCAGEIRGVRKLFWARDV
ncbi:hypothetical protein BC829DRAFT_387312 [Chytridium lagenaria]|nr:hypothetical protein BC829DRAFT_387312 [Chytridium lagenaria]